MVNNKYTNPTAQKLFKEFRKFQKWAPKNMYCFDSKKDQQEEFINNIKEILLY